MNKLNNDLLRDIQKQYNALTLILYGSQVRGDNDPNSDYDILCISSSAQSIHKRHLDKTVALDLLILPETNANDIDRIVNQFPQFIYSKVLLQEKGFGDKFLKRFCKVYKRGPKLDIQRRISIINWLDKMLLRLKNDDIVGHFRRHKFLARLLEIYFWLRGIWYTGPKESFVWLKVNDFLSYKLFEEALIPDAKIINIEILVRHIITNYECCK